MDLRTLERSCFPSIPQGLTFPTGAARASARCRSPCGRQGIFDWDVLRATDTAGRQAPSKPARRTLAGERTQADRTYEDGGGGGPTAGALAQRVTSRVVNQGARPAPSRCRPGAALETAPRHVWTRTRSSTDLQTAGIRAVQAGDPSANVILHTVTHKVILLISALSNLRRSTHFQEWCMLILSHYQI